MRKWIFCLIFGLLFNAFSNDEPVLEVKTTVTTTAKATNAYVAFLVRGQGLLISDAQKACDAKIAAVSEKIKERSKLPKSIRPQSIPERRIFKAGGQREPKSNRT